MKAPAFQFYAQDFLTGCTYLTNEEIGMYIKMLCKQWTDGSIPKKRLGFLVGIDWDNFSDELKGKFKDFGEFIANERLEKEREKKQNFMEKQANNGKKGGRPKKNNASESPNNTGDKIQLNPKPFENINPNKNQKKPLEDRRLKTEEENEIEIENENEEKKEPKQKIEILKENIVFPFETETFKIQWQLWKSYKDKEYGFKFKSPISEQANLKKLSEMAGNDEKKAIAIIHQSIENGWKGFFELKNNNNAATRTNEQIFTDAATSEVGRSFKFK